VRGGREKLHALAVQVHVGRDAFVQQHFVRQRRTAEAGMNLARQRAAADFRTALEHERLEPALREIERRGQRVVTRTDDDRVVHLAQISRRQHHFNAVHRE
jgi:triphosphoribosyl-dephospho-CoA synthetase